MKVSQVIHSDSDAMTEPYKSSSDDEAAAFQGSPPPSPLIDASTLVMVRGKYYDFTHFIHPGGQLMLVQGKGTDLTAAVASHHFTDLPYQRMKKYEVPLHHIQGIITPGGYTFNTDGFHNVLKQRIVQQLANGNVHKMREISEPSNAYIANVITVLCVYLLSWYFVCCNHNFSFIAAVTAAITRTKLVGIGHEAIHGRLSKPLFYLFGIVLCFPSEKWHYDHVILHHPHTKVPGVDADEDGLAPAIRLNRWTTWRFFHIFQIVLQAIVSFFFSMGLWLDHALVSTFVQKDGFSFQPKYFITQSLSLLMFQLLPLFMNATWTQALLNISIVVGMSNMLTLHAFHISHINEQNEQGEGWQIGMDWGEWQCRTSSNWDSAWWSTTGMLEYQIEHHLFPSLPYEIQNEIRPITKKTCQEFNVPYFEYSGMMVGIQEHLKYVWKLSMDGFNGYGMDEVVPKGIKSKKFQ